MAAPRPAGQTRQAVIAALRQRPMVEKDLLAAVGCCHSTLTREIARLRQEGRITRGYVLLEPKA